MLYAKSNIEKKHEQWFLFQWTKPCSASFRLKKKDKKIHFKKTHKLFNAISVSFSPLTQKVHYGSLFFLQLSRSRGLLCRSFLILFSNPFESSRHSRHVLPCVTEIHTCLLRLTEQFQRSACIHVTSGGAVGSGLRLVLQRPCVSFLSSQPDVSIKCVACTGIDEDCNPSQQYMSFFYYLKLWTFSIFFSACLVLSIMMIVLPGDNVLQF